MNSPSPDRVNRRDIHIRKHPNDATAKPVWCGEAYVASISEAWGFYGPGGIGHDGICHACIDAERAARRGQR